MKLWNPDACCYHCVICGTPTCRDAFPSPREDESICGECVAVAA